MRNLLKSGLRRLVSQPLSTRPIGDRHAHVLAVAAQKGGVGKTTTSVSLASAFARYHGKRVLLVDLDPQGHVATALAAQTTDGGGSLARVLTDAAAALEVMDIATPTSIEGLDITPLDPRLAEAEDLLSTRIGKEFILRDALKTTRSHYDVIVLDCPPNQGNLALNGLCAADSVVIPCDPSPLALKGVDALVQTIAKVAVRLNPEIDVLGILMTRVDGRNRSLNDAIAAEISERYGDAVLDATIGINSSLGKAQLAGTDIFGFDENSRGAVQYRALASELVTAVAGAR
jgi:chromosome partitioning protein